MQSIASSRVSDQTSDTSDGHSKKAIRATNKAIIPVDSTLGALGSWVRNLAHLLCSSIYTIFNDLLRKSSKNARNDTDTYLIGCIQSLDWNTGLDYWTGLLDSTVLHLYACGVRLMQHVVVQLCNDGRMHLSFSLRAG